jgi:integrase
MVLGDPPEGAERARDVRTLGQAVVKYNEVRKTLVPHALSESNYNRQREALSALLRVLSEDTLIEGIDHDAMIKVVGHWSSRPVTKHGTKMAIETVITQVQHFRQLLNYLEESGRWDGPKRWERRLSLRRADLMTTEEKKAKTKAKKNAVAVYTPEQIAVLWRHATDIERAYLIVALNICCTQVQLAQLSRNDISLNTDPPYFEIARGKTGVYAYYEMWPLTVPYVASAMASNKDAKRNPNGLLWLTGDGNTLVNWSDNGNKSDAVKQSWQRLLGRIPDDELAVKLPFSALRDTSSTAVLRLSNKNEYIQQQVLAHARLTMAGKHYTGESGAEDFAEANRVLKLWYAELRPHLVD